MVECDVLVVEGARAGSPLSPTAALRRRRSVCMVEETDWLGGQRIPGVAALDEHDEIGRFGGTASYYELRRLIRTHYERLSGRRPDPTFQPRPCWVGHLAFETQVARRRGATSLLRPFLESGTLRVLLRSKAFATSRSDIRVETVSVIALETGYGHMLSPAVRGCDATELGDLLPLARLAYRLGAVRSPRRANDTPNPKPLGLIAFKASRTPSPLVRCTSAPVPALPRQFVHATIEVHAGEIYGEESGWLAYRARAYAWDEGVAPI